MKRIVALLIGALFFASPSRAETPCDFKGISVGNKMASAEIMAALGVAKYKMNPARPSFDKTLALAHHSGWTTWQYAGDPAKARQHADIGRVLYDPERHASDRLIYGGHDPGVCAGNVGAQVEWLLGYPEKALASIADALALAELIAHPFTLSLVFINSSWFTSTAMSQSEPCANSKPPRCWLRNNGSR
jgi:hypothetical protein